MEESAAADAALNAGGPSVYLVEDMHHYRLFFKTAVEVAPGKEYIAEGVYAQKAIDEMGRSPQAATVSSRWPGVA